MQLTEIGCEGVDWIKLTVDMVWCQVCENGEKPFDPIKERISWAVLLLFSGVSYDTKLWKQNKKESTISFCKASFAQKQA